MSKSVCGRDQRNRRVRCGYVVQVICSKCDRDIGLPYEIDLILLHCDTCDVTGSIFCYASDKRLVLIVRKYRKGEAIVNVAQRYTSKS